MSTKRYIASSTWRSRWNQDLPDELRLSYRRKRSIICCITSAPSEWMDWSLTCISQSATKKSSVPRLHGTSYDRFRARENMKHSSWTYVEKWKQYESARPSNITALDEENHLDAYDRKMETRETWIMLWAANFALLLWKLTSTFSHDRLERPFTSSSVYNNIL